MIYVAKDINGNLIAYSSNMDYIFKYLENLYRRNDKLTINLYKEYDEKNITDFYVNYEEYNLVPFWNNIILTEWENILYEEVFVLRQSYLSESMYKRVEFVPEEHRLRYLKDQLGSDKYKAMINFNYFMEFLGEDGIYHIINNSPLTYDLYDIRQQYKRKINDDK